MSWTSSRIFKSKNGIQYEVIERSILGYYPHLVCVTFDDNDIEVIGEGNTRKAAFADIKQKLMPTLKNAMLEQLKEIDETQAYLDEGKTKNGRLSR